MVSLFNFLSLIACGLGVLTAHVYFVPAEHVVEQVRAPAVFLLDLS